MPWAISYYLKLCQLHNLQAVKNFLYRHRVFFYLAPFDNMNAVFCNVWNFQKLLKLSFQWSMLQLSREKLEISVTNLIYSRNVLTTCNSSDNRRCFFWSNATMSQVVLGVVSFSLLDFISDSFYSSRLNNVKTDNFLEDSVER